MKQQVTKKLSANDVGDTGGHQAGILVPKEEHILSFFPALDGNLKNPRQTLVVREAGSGERWNFAFIYYNNKFFGGTRNEYRLTHMTKFLRAVSARVGDELRFTRDENMSYLIELCRASSPGSQAEMYDDNSSDILVLSGGWKVINY